MAENLFGRTRVITQTPTITASSAYASGNALGGKLTFSSAIYNPQPTQNNAGGGGIIFNVLILDKDKQSAPIDVVLFKTDFTASTDKTAFDPSAGDMANCVGVISITASDYVTFANYGIATVNKPLAFRADGAALYAQLVMRGTPTYTTTSSIGVALKILQD
jgi:hypothetical protein